MGLQIIGPRNSDLTCLQLAYAYENATSWIENRPSLLLDPEFRDTHRR